MSEHVEDLVIGLKGDVSQYVSAMHQAEKAGKDQARSAQAAVTQNNAQARSHRGLAATIRSSSVVQAASLGAVIYGYKSVAQAAANYDTTLRQIAVASNTATRDVPKVTKDLGDLAIKLGKDTVFSAQDAAQAMLELAKGGLTTAQIKAGATASTLTLASAGGLQLANAAGYIVQGLTTFNLTAGQSADVAAALAGGANASTASVEDMGLALSQVGPSAVNAGLTLQDTTAVLAAFANNGIKGSDAGTSLKTMLQRLTPTTKAQKNAMRDLGLEFVDAHGNFKDIADVAQQLHDKLGPLTESQRSQALTTIFGSDAQRAASILTKEGAKGIRDLTKATTDKTQADKLAKAATSGSAGALSQLSGSIDTAKLQIGEALTPLTIDIANHMTDWTNVITDDVVPAVADFVKGMEDGTGPGGQFASVVGDLGDAAKSAWDMAQPIFGFIGDHPHLFAEVAKDAALLAASMKAMSLLKKIPGLGGGGALGGLTGATSGGVVPVYVTNEGFGGPGNGGPGKGPGSNLVAAGGWATIGAVAASAVESPEQKLVNDGKKRGGLFGGLENAAGQALLFSNTVHQYHEFKKILDGDSAAALDFSDSLNDVKIKSDGGAAALRQLTTNTHTAATAGQVGAQKWAAALVGPQEKLTNLDSLLLGLPTEKTITVRTFYETVGDVAHAATTALNHVFGRGGGGGSPVPAISPTRNPATRDQGIHVHVGTLIGTSPEALARELEPHVTAAQTEAASRWGSSTVRSTLVRR